MVGGLGGWGGWGPGAVQSEIHTISIYPALEGFRV